MKRRIIWHLNFFLSFFFVEKKEKREFAGESKRMERRKDKPAKYNESRK